MRVLVLLMLAIVALSGCGDKASDGVAFETPSKEDGVYVITVGSTIDPANAKVPKEGIVEWRVESGGCHLLADDDAFDSKRSQGGGTTYNNGIVPAGQSYRWFADSPGDHAYKCSGRSVAGVLRVG